MYKPLHTLNNRIKKKPINRMKTEFKIITKNLITSSTYSNPLLSSNMRISNHHSYR